MKYNEKNKPLQCTMTQSAWYKEMKNFPSKPVGVLWHDTGAGNPYVKRYVQPSENDINRSKLLTKIGKNAYGNHWNLNSAAAGVNAFIGTMADGSVQTVQVGPLTMPPWGCGNGSKGSCNGYTGNLNWQGVHWVQFEICDDGYGDRAYFDKCYKEAVEFTAYVCKVYGISPKGTVKFNGVTVPTILCHADSHALGLGSGHGDVLSWFGKYGKTMQDVRNDVEKLLKEKQEEVMKKGENTLGIYAMKRLLMLAKAFKLVPSNVADDGGYGDGTDKDVKAIQKLAGLMQKTEANEATVRAIYVQTLDALNAERKKATAEITAAKAETAKVKAQLDAAKKEMAAISAKAGDLNADGKVNTKDLLALRKLLAQ